MSSKYPPDLAAAGPYLPLKARSGETGPAPASNQWPPLERLPVAPGILFAGRVRKAAHLPFRTHLCLPPPAATVRAATSVCSLPSLC
jgi:hypothetical protein